MILKCQFVFFFQEWEVTSDHLLGNWILGFVRWILKENPPKNPFYSWVIWGYADEAMGGWNWWPALAKSNPLHHWPVTTSWQKGGERLPLSRDWKGTMSYWLSFHRWIGRIQSGNQSDAICPLFLLVSLLLAATCTKLLPISSQYTRMLMLLS